MRIVILVVLVCAIAACSETDRITASQTPRSTATAVAVSSAAPAATSARPTTTLSPTPTPSRTSSASPAATAATSAQPSVSATAATTPSLPPGASLPAMPSQPALPAGVTALSTGTLAFTLSAGQTRTFEGQALATAGGATPPPSAGLVWTVAWRATDPLGAAVYRQTSRTELGRGRWGTAELGGAGFELRNEGATTVVGELSYTIGSR